MLGVSPSSNGESAIVASRIESYGYEIKCIYVLRCKRDLIHLELDPQNRHGKALPWMLFLLIQLVYPSAHIPEKAVSSSPILFRLKDRVVPERRRAQGPANALALVQHSHTAEISSRQTITARVLRLRSALKKIEIVIFLNEPCV